MCDGAGKDGGRFLPGLFVGSHLRDSLSSVGIMGRPLFGEGGQVLFDCSRVNSLLFVFKKKENPML